MSSTSFYLSINKAFELMIENKLREDMDDTLLEKLLSTLKLGIINNQSDSRYNMLTNSQEIDFIKDLLNSTQAFQLVEKVVLSLKDKNIKLLTSIKVFALRFLSLIFESESFFVTYKDSTLLLNLCGILDDNVPNMHYPSIEDAILCCLSSISKHPEGTLWLIERGLLDYAFSSLCCKSYYVRKTAINFFSSILTLWNSPEFSSQLKSQQALVQKTSESIALQIIEGINLTSRTCDTTVSECCILILKKCFETNSVESIVCSDFQLIEKISNYFRDLTEADAVDDSIINLLLAVYSCNPQVESVIKEVIATLVECCLFVPAMQLASSFLGISKQLKPLSMDHLHFLVMPLYILSGEIPLTKEDVVFGMTSDRVYCSLMRKMEVKSNCIKLLVSALSSLLKLTSFMSPEALHSVIMSIGVVVTEPVSPQAHSMSYVCLENRNICLSFLELFASLTTDSIYPNLTDQSQITLFEYALNFLKRPPFDFNILAEVLRLLKYQIALNAKCSVPFCSELRDKLTELLCRKLLDSKEPVVDNALHLAGQILCGEDNKLWKESVIKHSIHAIVWEIAIDGCHEGFIKASALKVVIEACLVPYWWDDIKTTKGVNEEDIIKILCTYFHDPDFFIQRESIACIHKWMQKNEKFLPSSRKEDVFLILSCAVRSLDLELKLVALAVWQWFEENSESFRSLSSGNINTYLNMLCSTGFGSSLMVAIEDYDEAVKFKAAGILLNFRRKLSSLGYSKDFVPKEETKNKNGALNPVVKCSFELVSKEEKMAGIETVMMLSTTEQLTNLCRTTDSPYRLNLEESGVSSLKLDPTSCSVISFYNLVWSEQLDTIASTEDIPSSVFSEHSLSLLDDIIAAEETKVFHPDDDTPDCY